MKSLLKTFFLIALVACNRAHDLKDFESSVLYNIDWPGLSLEKTFDEYEKEGYESMIITTKDLETYKCMIPPAPKEKVQKESDTTNLSPLKVLSPIFASKICSYRFENYWSYELCHGEHIKQFHEERDGKNIKVQEYFLGKWDKFKTEQLEEQLRKDTESGKPLKTTKIDNVKYPYIEIEMADGTLCDLINQYRVTRVRYICYPHGKNEIFSLKETSTCNYEMIVLTSALCMLPAFLPETSMESDISCVPVNGSPEKPLSWLVNKVEDMQLRYKPVPDAVKPKDSIAIIKVDAKDGTLRVDIITPKQDERLIKPDTKDEDDDNVTPAIENHEGGGGSSTSKSTQQPKMRAPLDLNPALEFLKGEHCLIGGSGWWQYEFCYGKYIRQFHDKTEDKKSLILGYFDEKAHKNYLKENPEKRPLPKSIRTHVNHFYHDGTICDKTGEKRQTEVKLKCGAMSPSAVAMFLLEPEVCKYVLTIESKLICDVLKEVDADGLIPDLDAFKLDYTEDVPVINGDRKSGSRGGEKKGDGVFAGNIIVEDIEVRYEND